VDRDNDKASDRERDPHCDAHALLLQDPPPILLSRRIWRSCPQSGLKRVPAL
jgi:hypothetical protein